LILRDLLLKGDQTFTQFLESPERISTNILTSRLNKLRECGLIQRGQSKSKSKRKGAYSLTPVGKDFDGVIRALGVWSSKHLHAHHPEMYTFSE
jgi:DNA-binding HxlR family transcriptional regulator